MYIAASNAKGPRAGSFVTQWYKKHAHSIHFYTNACVRKYTRVCIEMSHSIHFYTNACVRKYTRVCIEMYGVREMRV